MSFSEPNQTPSASSEFRPKSVWTPIRQGLLSWFRAKAPSLAPAYEGAVTLLADPEFPGRIHFIAHAIRDICNRLVFTPDGTLASPHLDYPKRLSEIERVWPTQHNYSAPPTPSQNDSVSITYALFQQIDGLVNEHRNCHATNRTRYERLFRHFLRDEPFAPHISKRLVNYFMQTKEWFMKWAHLTDHPLPPVNEQELISRFEAFERTLHSFVGNFFTGTKELNAILRQANK